MTSDPAAFALLAAEAGAHARAEARILLTWRPVWVRCCVGVLVFAAAVTVQALGPFRRRDLALAALLAALLVALRRRLPLLAPAAATAVLAGVHAALAGL